MPGWVVHTNICDIKSVSSRFSLSSLHPLPSPGPFHSAQSFFLLKEKFLHLSLSFSLPFSYPDLSPYTPETARAWVLSAVRRVLFSQESLPSSPLIDPPFTVLLRRSPFLRLRTANLAHFVLSHLGPLRCVERKPGVLVHLSVRLQPDTSSRSL